MSINYNSKDYIELLKLRKALIEQGKTLDSNIEKKLGEYHIILEDYIHWKYRNQYLSLTRDFVKGFITGDKFLTQFYKLYNDTGDEYNQLRNNYSELEKVRPDSKSIGFSIFPGNIYLLSAEYYSDDELELKSENSFGMNENEFRTTLENYILVDMKDYE